MIQKNTTFLALLLLPMVAPETQADEACLASLTASFTESAPRDYFRFRHESESGWSVVKIVLSLDTADGDLVFDTNDGGKGVEVFQPFRKESSTASSAELKLPNDGGQSIEIVFTDFPAGADYSFSIDVDDQLSQSKLGNIRVAGSEMNGATIQVEFATPEGTRVNNSAVFGDKNRSVVSAGC